MLDDSHKLIFTIKIHRYWLEMGRKARYLGFRSILLKYHDEILQPPLRLNYKLLSPIFMLLQTSYSTRNYEQNCHVLVATIYNLNLACQLILMKKNLKYWEQTRNLKKFLAFISYFVHLATFIAIL